MEDELNKSTAAPDAQPPVETGPVAPPPTPSEASAAAPQPAPAAPEAQAEPETQAESQSQPGTDPLNLHALAPSDRDQAAEAAVARKHRNKRAWRDFWSFLGILIIAGLLSWGMITYVFRSYSVDGPSMETTLMNNDKLVIWKLPRTWARITGHQYVPKRGDIIVFHLNDLGACGQIGGRDIIKRVIGLPGERVVVANNVITVYNKQHPHGFQPDATLPYDQDGHIPPTDGNIDETLGPHQIFVSGDNRPNSCDSRAFGPVNLNDVVGKLAIRLLPITKAKIF